jgi:hypothetical protein
MKNMHNTPVFKNKLSLSCSTFISTLNQLHSIIIFSHLISYHFIISVYSSHLYFNWSKQIKTNRYFIYFRSSLQDARYVQCGTHFSIYIYSVFVRWCLHSPGLSNGTMSFIISYVTFLLIVLSIALAVLYLNGWPTADEIDVFSHSVIHRNSDIDYNTSTNSDHYSL